MYFSFFLVAFFFEKKNERTERRLACEFKMEWIKCFSYLIIS